MAYLAQFIVFVSMDFSAHTQSAAATSITQLMQSLVTELLQVSSLTEVNSVSMHPCFKQLTYI